jgi:PAS domain S-box-containing protein
MGTDRRLKLADLVDARMLQSMMEDFHALTQVPMALIDLEGTVIVGVGWQDVCTRFHRVNPQTCAFCIESDTVLTADIPAGEMRLYHCKNGMWDAATPVLVGSERVGNLFTGQFFFEDEPVDLAAFRAQASRYGFDEGEYLKAVEAVPRLSHATVETGMKFLTSLSTMISLLTFSDARRALAEEESLEALAAQTALAEDLSTQHNILSAIMENTAAHLAYLDPDFNFVAVNSTYAHGSGHTKEELIGQNHFDLFPNEENQAAFEHAKQTGLPLEYSAKPFVFPDQPWRGVTYWDWRLTAVTDPEGALAGFAFSLIDITQQVRGKAFSDATNRLNDVIHADLNLDTFLEEFLPQLAEVVGCETAAVVLRTAEGGWRRGEVFGLADDLADRVLGDRRFAQMMETTSRARPGVLSKESAPELLGELGIESVAIVPLVLADAQFGALVVGYTSGPGEFDDSVMDFLGKIGASLSLALNNSRLFHAERRSALLSAALAKVNEILLSALTLEDVLAGLVGEASEAAGADKCLVIEVKGDRYTVTHVRNVISTDLVGVPREDRYYRAFLAAANEGRPLLIEDCWTDPRTNKEFVVPYELRAFQLLPLTTQGIVTHVLALAYDAPRTFDEEDHRSAARMTTAMSVALNNARLFENEHRIADRLQEAFLGLREHVDGVEFARAYHSATEAARVGGDFYDVFDLDARHVGITIGDISGKGIDAAALTALVKYTVRAHASEEGATPVRVLARTNDLVYRSTPPEMFATVFFAMLDRTEGRLHYASAGHTTCLILGKDGVLTELGPTGPVLGGFPQWECEAAVADLDADDLLFLYTDGLTEARGKAGHYGESRVLSLLSGMGGASPQQVVAETIADVMVFTENLLRDDLAVLVVRRAEGDGSQ